VHNSCNILRKPPTQPLRRPARGKLQELCPWLMQEIRPLVHGKPHRYLPSDAPRRHNSCISHKHPWFPWFPYGAWPGRVDLERPAGANKGNGGLKVCIAGAKSSPGGGAGLKVGSCIQESLSGLLNHLMPKASVAFTRRAGTRATTNCSAQQPWRISDPNGSPCYGGDTRPRVLTTALSPQWSTVKLSVSRAAARTVTATSRRPMSCTRFTCCTRSTAPGSARSSSTRP